MRWRQIPNRTTKWVSSSPYRMGKTSPRKMPATNTATATPTSRPDVEPASAEATQTATAATGGTHRTGTSHQSILDGYHRSCSADMDTLVVVSALVLRRRSRVPVSALALPDLLLSPNR